MTVAAPQAPSARPHALKVWWQAIRPLATTVAGRPRTSKPS